MSLIPKLHLGRVRQVTSAFYDLGFETWIKKIELHYLLPIRQRLLFWSKKNKTLPLLVEAEYESRKKEFPKRLRLALEKLGGTYIKLGQMLSLRADLVGEEIADELSKLQDAVLPFPFSQAKQIIEKELGKPLNKIFKKFDETPVGAASLAQVHKATLPDGKTVAVKILRPNIEAQVREDIALLKWAAKTIEERISSLKPFHPVKFVNEFADWTLRELNLINEATNIEHFRELFKGEEHIYIPLVHWQYATKKVLATDFSFGAKIDDFGAYPALNCSREEVAAIGVKLAFKQFFEFGFFHGDPHPGNLFIKNNNTICLHDFGIVGRIDENTRRELIGCYLDLFERDAEGATRHLLHIAALEENSDTDGFRRKVVEILETWLYTPGAGRRLSAAFYKMIISGASRKISFPQNVALLAKAVVTMESVALKIDPKFNLIESLRPYLNQLLTMELKPEAILKRGRETLLDSARLAVDLPEAARKFVKLLEQEAVGVRLDTREFIDIKREIDRQSDIRILSMILVADLLATSVLLHLEGVQKIAGIPLGAFGVTLAAFLTVAVLFKIRKGYK